MRRFFSFLVDSRTLSIVGAIALAAFLILGAQLFDIGLIWAGVVLAVCLSIWLLVWLMRRVRIRRANRKLGDMLEEQAEAAAVGGAAQDPARKAEIDALRARMVEAVKTIKTSKIGQASGNEALYELPWYMVIGNPAAGKSTAILNSGLQFPFAEKGNAVIQGIGGTRNCDWFFTTEGIVLDTAGRYSVHQEDRREWFGFLDLLKRYRPKAPINGIIVTASIPELIGSRPDFAINLAKSLRERVQELTERLEIFAPVYVMFTKADLITGFAEFFGDSDKVERDRVWGATLPYEQDEKQDAVALFDKRFDELYVGLKEISVAHIATRRGANPSPELLIFPLEFAATKPALRAFLATLFESNPFQHKPIFRGFYFTSALQEGTLRSLSTERIASRFGLALTGAGNKAKELYSQNGFFLRDLFSKVVFADKKTVRQFSSPVKTRLRYLTFFGFVASLGLLLGGWTWSYLGNRQLVKNVQADLDKVVKMQAGDAGLKARFEALGILQDRIEQLVKFREDRPLSLSFGLYQGNTLEDKLVAEYYGGIKQVMLSPVADNLQTFLREVNAHPDQLKRQGVAAAGSTAPAAQTAGASTGGTAGTTPPSDAAGLYAGSSPADVQDAYNALKTYLMLGDKRHVETAHLTDQISRFWRGWLEANRGDMTRQQVIRDAERMITFYLSRVGDDNWPALADTNLALVEQTRDALRLVVRGMPARERVYAEIKARASTRFAPMTVARILGANPTEGETVITGSSAISGAFTREAWQQYVDPAIRDAANKETSNKDWVLNVAGNDDLTLEGSPEQIRKTLVTMYKVEYAKEWQRFLQGISVRELGSFDQAVNAMNTLGDPQNSPIRKVFNTVYEQTSWDNPSLVNAGLQQAGSGAMNWFKRLFSRAAPSQVNVNVNIDPASGNAVEIPMGPVGKEFAGVGRIVVERDNTSLLKGYLGALSKLRTRFNQIKNQGDPGPGARQLMQQTLDGNGSELADALKYVDEQMLTGMDLAQRQALRPLLVRPLLGAYAVTIQPTAVELNKVWNAQVYQLFQQSLATKYPFAASAKIEAAPSEIAQMFGPEGAVSKFVTTTMGPLVIRRGDLLSPRAWGDQGLRLNQDFVTGFAQWVAPLAGGAATGGGAGGQAQTLFQILPQPVSGVTEYLIEIDGQQLRYRNTPPQWSNFVWPNAQGSPGAKISAVTFDGTTVELINEPGNFGLERLINTAERKRVPDGSFELTWTKEAVAVTVKLRLVQTSSADGGADSPQGRGFRGTSLPSSVVDIGAPSSPTESGVAAAAGAGE